MESYKNGNGSRARVVLLIGPPGSGKGTQGSLLAERLQVPVISTGDMLRRESQAGTALGDMVRSILDKGSLVSDDLINRLMAARLRLPDCRRGFALDGYPRTAPQAQFLDGLLDALSLPRPTVLHLVVSRETLLARLTARRHCGSCGRIYNLLQQPPRRDGRCDTDSAPLILRSDDSPQVIAERLKVHEQAAAPLIRYYHRTGNYHRIDGDRSFHEVLADLSRLLEPASAVLQAG
jgi:adenylate kinase